MMIARVFSCVNGTLSCTSTNCCGRSDVEVVLWTSIAMPGNWPMMVEEVLGPGTRKQGLGSNTTTTGLRDSATVDAQAKNICKVRSGISCRKFLYSFLHLYSFSFYIYFHYHTRCINIILFTYSFFKRI